MKFNYMDNEKTKQARIIDRIEQIDKRIEELAGILSPVLNFGPEAAECLPEKDQSLSLEKLDLCIRKIDFLIARIDIN